jgi:hypothetical protein
MAKERGPDGKPVEVDTFRPDKGGHSGDDETVKRPKSAGPKPSIFGDSGEAPTVPSGPRTAPPSDRKEEPKTHISGWARTGGTRGDVTSESRNDNDPVVGWLVIVSGPGRGLHKKIGAGVNTVGRDADNRIPMPHGDTEISRHAHARIIYDKKNRQFLIQQGDGVNLVYLDEVPVLSPTILEDHAEIEIGKTRLRFVAFCGPRFSWDDPAASEQ